MISQFKASLVSPLLKILGDCDVNSVKFATAYMALQGLSCLLSPSYLSFSGPRPLLVSVLESLHRSFAGDFCGRQRFVKFFTRLVPFYSSCPHSGVSFYLLLVSITALLVFLSLLLSSCIILFVFFVVSLPHKYEFHESGDCVCLVL